MSRHLGALVVVFSLLAACGGGDEQPPPPDEISVRMTDFSFSPDLWRVPAATSITVTADNAGGVAHNWVVLRTPIEALAEFDEADALALIQTTAGSSVTETIEGIPAGTYQVICTIEGHLAAGMEAELRVGP